ncbi:NAD(P)-dependent oxidoreductase [Aeromicrobium sp. Sec7.5]|uniref:NAD(P)-dependent oxidoreductase n=1 Tax=Aeromicrobium sp. Sec7.5 TaxID=3121276 RepID=UPI002FE4885F
MTDTNDMTSISVLGLGAMGATIAGALATDGRRVRAWNRTPKNLSDGQVDVVESPAAAVDDADLVVVCVRDHAASRAVLEQIAPHLEGQVVVNLSTGTPAEAAESAEHAAGLGVRYVTGAVMVPTPLVATERCVVLYAGDPADLDQAAPLHAAMRGTSDVVGTDHAVPPALDLAMLDIYFAGMYAHLHATALAAAHGIDPQRFLPYAQGIVGTLGASLPDLTASVAARQYDAGQARLDMCLSFLEHIVASSREAGIDPGLAELVRAASARAMTSRTPGTDWDVVAEDFLPPSA